MTMIWKSLLSTVRLGEDGTGDEHGPARSDFERDFDRIVFSKPFRRLHDKTQVFPLTENDHVHTRLSHSLEVSCVGRSLGKLAGDVVKEKDASIDVEGFGAIVAAACLAHDIGNPPFGHSGERAIGEWARKIIALDKTDSFTPQQKAALEDYEGNAAGFSILVRTQQPDRGGLRLTLATLGAFLKYPHAKTATSLSEQKEGVDKHGVCAKKYGFFEADESAFEKVANGLGLKNLENNTQWARHPLAFVVEAADDICNRVIDFEDGYRMGLIPHTVVKESLEAIADENEYFLSRKNEYKKNAPDDGEYVGALRAHAINQLEARDAFSTQYNGIMAGTCKDNIMDGIPSIENLKRIKDLVEDHCYEHPDVLAVELAGFEVLGRLLDTFWDALLPVPNGKERAIKDTEKPLAHLPPKSALVIRSHKPLEKLLEDPPYKRALGIAQYVGGFTDAFATRAYRQLIGTDLPGRAK